MSSLADVIRDNAAVLCPDGYTGRVRVTRRERKLIAAGEKTVVRVEGTDGLERDYPLGELLEQREWYEPREEDYDTPAID